MTSHLMYQKQDIKVRKILNNFQKVTDFKKDCFLSLIAFATAILWQWSTVDKSNLSLRFVIKIWVGVFQILKKIAGAKDTLNN